MKSKGMQLVKLWFLIIFISYLTSCSNTRIIYTLAESFIQNEISFFINLKKDEKYLLSKQISKMLNWHRTTMLPSYSLYLTGISDMLSANRYSYSGINKVFMNGRSLIEDTITGLTPFASQFIIRHQTFENIEFMEKKMTMRRKELLAELSQSKDILYNQRLEKLITNFERFFDNLNDKQLVFLKKYARITLDDSKIRLFNRTQRQKVFIDFLKKQPSEKELTIYLNKLLLKGHIIINSNYKSFSEISIDRFSTLLVNMLMSSSKSQREKIISKLREYAADFDEVAG